MMRIEQPRQPATGPDIDGDEVCGGENIPEPLSASLLQHSGEFAANTSLDLKPGRTSEGSPRLPLTTC